MWCWAFGDPGVIEVFQDVNIYLPYILDYKLFWGGKFQSQNVQLTYMDHLVESKKTHHNLKSNFADGRQKRQHWEFKSHICLSIKLYIELSTKTKTKTANIHNILTQKI